MNPFLAKRFVLFSLEGLGSTSLLGRSTIFTLSYTMP